MSVTLTSRNTEALICEMERLVVHLSGLIFRQKKHDKGERWQHGRGDDVTCDITVGCVEFQF